MLTGIDHIQIAVPRARERDCVAFYRSVLGLTEIPKPEELRGRGGAWFQLGAQQVHIGVEDHESPPSKRHICFKTPDVAAARAAIEAQGVATEDERKVEGLDRFFLRDPAGNRIEITAA